MKTIFELMRDGYWLKQTCTACPEQYDVFIGNNQIGYLRLRHGSFTASFPDHMGEIVYTAHPEGDGIFEDHERKKYIREALNAIDFHERRERKKLVKKIFGKG